MRPPARSFTPPPPAPRVLGYVVVIFRDSGIEPTRLTNSDLMDRESAENEAASWRRQSQMGEIGDRYEVCPVMGEKR